MVDNKLCGTLNWATGVGKTRGGLMAISRFLKKNPTKSVIVVVPVNLFRGNGIKN